MSVHCPQCGKEYDVIQFENGRHLKCPCGFELDVSFLETFEDFMRYSENEEERRKALEIQRDAQDVCRMILNDICSRVDIEIAKENLKEKVARLFPGKMEIYRMIYESRFDRLWQQFREGNAV